MKAAYTSVLLALLGTSMATAQDGNSVIRFGNALKQRHYAVAPTHQPITHSAQRDVIWSDDLSNPSTWIIGTAPDRDPDTWVIGTDGPTGTFSSTYGTLESTTAANGFALFDSDLACSGNQEPTLQTATPIDLSGYPGAVLEFEQLFSRFRGDCFVDVSSDGTNWTEFEVNAEVDVNTSTDNPDLRRVNLSSFGGESTVWIRFRYFSTEDEHGNGAGCDYAWMIDDVAVVTLPDNDIIVNLGYVSQTGDGEEYGRVPLSQWVPTLNVGVELTNFGSQTQTNITVDIACENADGLEIFQTQQTATDMNVTDTLVTDGEVTMEDPAVGIYTTTFTVNSDQIALDASPENNSRVRTFQVTTDIYSLDNIGAHPSGQQELEQVGTLSFENNSENVKLMNFYVIHNTMQVTGLEIGLGSLSEPGASIVISLLDTADVFATPSVVNQAIAESDPHVLTQAEITAGKVTIEFPGPVTLTPNAYYAVASLFADGDNDVFVQDDLTVPQPNAASMVWIPFDPGANQNLYGGNGTAWAVRLTSNPTIGISEADELDGVTMFPNPTNGMLRISTATNVRHTVEVLSMIGGLVRTVSFNGSGGIDVTDLAEGVYTVRVSDGTRTTQQKVSVTR